MKINGIVETALSVDDVARSAEFYQRLFDFPVLHKDSRFCSLVVPGEAVLLLFKKGDREEPIPTPGGIIPPHGARGRMHFAFKISGDAVEACEQELAAKGVAIESKVHWPRGGVSLYFRDPDEHLVEVITRGCWENY